ncbi:MAG: hypothetical protein BYD32DRAFT_364324, partial [Podila humilis]
MGDDNESESDIPTATTTTTTATTTTSTSTSHVNNQDDEDEDEDAGIIRCICNYTDDDGFTIQCEHCLVWQHAVCVGIVQSNVPDRYLCEQCSPRPVDRKRANEVQRRRIAEDEDLEMESDNSQEDLLDSYQFEFSSVEMNIVTSKAVQDLFRQVISQFRQAQSRKRSLPDLSSTLGTAPPPGADTTNVVSMERESLARPLMKVTVKHILSSSKTHHSPAPQYGLFAESNIGAGRFMMEFKGEVSLKSTYKSDPINQYSILATPKPFVLFHPHLDLVVDARRSGNDARFVRRSCFPNTEVKSIVVPGVQDQTVHLGLFAKVPIGKGQEITLDWDWKRDHPALQPLRSDKSKDLTRKSSKEIRKAKFMVASTLLAQTDCACDNKDTCVLHQMMKDGMIEPSPRDNDVSKGKPK